MKILIATTHELKGGMDGGASYSMELLVNELINRGHDITTFVCPKVIHPYGMFPLAHKRARLNTRFGNYLLDRIVKENRPDIIHTSGFGACLMGHWIAFCHSIPWVYHCRSPSDVRFFYSELTQSNHIITIGEYMNRLNLPPNIPKTVIYNPITFDVKPNFSTANRDGIVMVTGLDGRKGTHIGIKGWSRLKERPPLHIYGRAYKRAMWAMDGKNDIIHYAFQPNHVIREALKRAMFVVTPITCKGFGINRVMLEAQSVGTLVLASAGFDGYDDPPIINSIRFKPKVGDVRRVIDKAMELSSNEYMTKTKRAYNWVKENCTAEKCADDVETVYKEVFGSAVYV